VTPRTTLSGAIAALLSLALASSAAAQSAPPPVKPVGVIGAPGGTGRFPAVAESFDSMRMNTVYRPAKPADGPLPLILWGNGACVDDGLSHAAFLREVASHGFIVIAAGHPRRDRSVEPEPPAQPRPAPAPGAAPARLSEQTEPQQLLTAIAWVQRENADPKSSLHGRIDLKRIGVMGHSCGGLQALAVAADPRVSTAILFNSGVFTDAPPPNAQGVLATQKSALLKLHGPVAYIDGGPTDIAYRNGLDDFTRLEHVPVFFGENGVGHDGTFWSAPNGGDYAQVAAAWMAWQLKNDRAAAKMFQGADCGLCTDAKWIVRKKRIDNAS